MQVAVADMVNQRVADRRGPFAQLAGLGLVFVAQGDIDE
jgi:hypothetical protein